MLPLNSANDPLRRYVPGVVDHLLNARPRTVRRLLADVLAGAGERLGCDHVHLFTVRRQLDGGEVATLSVQWSAADVSLPTASLKQVPLSLFSSTVSRILRAEQTVCVRLSTSRSRLISGLMRETGTTTYVLIPIHLGKQLRGIVGVAHDGDVNHIQKESGYHLKLIGRLAVQSLRNVRREARSRRDRRQWKRIADASCDFGMCLDQTGEIRRVIPFRADDPPRVEGLLLNDFFLLRDVPVLRRMIERAVTRREPQTCHARAFRSSGAECWYHVRVEPQPGSAKHRVTLFLTDNDVQRSRQDELDSLREHLHRASRLSLLGQVSAEFAHQINQPLQAILTYSETMLHRELHRSGNVQKRLRSLKHILASVEQASAIVTRIRDFAKQKILRRAPVDLTTIVQRAMIIARPRAEESGVMLICHNECSNFTECADSPEDSAPPQPMGDTVYVDAVQTTHVLINLIVNAVEACSGVASRTPRVEVLVQPHPDCQYLLIQVRDNGTGLPGDDPEIAFQKFRSTKPEGLGMGLSISRSVIEAQQGNLWAANNPDGGCTFSFTVRRSDGNQTETTELPVISGVELPAD